MQKVDFGQDSWTGLWTDIWTAMGFGLKGCWMTTISNYVLCSLENRLAVDTKYHSGSLYTVWAELEDKNTVVNPCEEGLTLRLLCSLKYL